MSAAWDSDFRDFWFLFSRLPEKSLRPCWFIEDDLKRLQMFSRKTVFGKRYTALCLVFGPHLLLACTGSLWLFHRVSRAEVETLVFSNTRVLQNLKLKLPS